MGVRVVGYPDEDEDGLITMCGASWARLNLSYYPVSLIFVVYLYLSQPTVRYEWSIRLLPTVLAIIYFWYCVHDQVCRRKRISAPSQGRTITHPSKTLYSTFKVSASQAQAIE